MVHAFDAAHPARPERNVVPAHDLRGVLEVPAFRKLWTALSLSSFGDWLGLLALTALAPRLANGGYAAANLAIAGVFILRLAPAIIIGPLGGVIADRLDRRWTMVVCDVLRFALFLSIPLVGKLWWLFVATFLIEAASLVWIPAKEATLPNLVPRERLETANQLSLFTTYGSAPVAAAVFAGLALVSGMLDNAVTAIDEADLALFFNAATFLVSALTIVRLTEIPSRDPSVAKHEQVSVGRTLVEGWRFVAHTRLVRGLVVGMLGAFAAGGAVVGLARTFVTDLGAGDPGYGLLFGTVFLGLAAGMFFGPRLVPDFSRRRLFGVAIAAAGLALTLLALVPNMVIAVFVTFVLGLFAGVAWVTGYTLLGLEIADEMRGRTFAFVQTMVRVVLVAVLAVAPLLAAAFGRHQIAVTDAMALTYNGAAITFLLGGLLATVLGLASYRHLDDRRGVRLFADLAAAYNNEPVGLRRAGPRTGFFIALEGGEGAGKSTQAELLADWLRTKGHDVEVTFEPGATEVGRRLRGVLLDHTDELTGETRPSVSPRAEALLFAADRAEHVAGVILPALERGAVVITDRYIDSSVAYQGGGRELAAPELARLSRWATAGLTPDLTVLLDLPATDGLARVQEPDRLESEPQEFHDRVRERFLEQARRGGARYLVVDATGTPEAIAAAVQERLDPLLPISASEQRELDGRRRREEEQRRLAAEERARQEAARAEELARRQAAEAQERERSAAVQRAEDQARRAAAETARQEAHAEKERQRAAHTEKRERRRAEAEVERAAAAADRARRAMEEAESRRQSAETRAAGQHRAAGDTSTPAPDAAPVDPPTRKLSLADELFGAGDDDATTETIHLPRVNDAREDR
ncbi:MAG: dTMP kinase [Actinomycetota bacterium]|nr:dTMP kinase [Actinomycetota bacterium]